MSGNAVTGRATTTMTDAVADGGRRLFLTGAIGASAVLLMGHSPYRRWAQYRGLHTVIAADRADPPSFPLCERLVARLATRRPELKAIAGRAENAATVGSLLTTRQLDLGLLRADDARHVGRGRGPGPDRATPLLALVAVAPEYLYVLVAAPSPVRALTDLRGRRVGVADSEGRAQVKARRLLAASGLDPDADVRWTSLAAAEGIPALGRGDLDAWVFESPSPGPALGLPPAHPLRLVPQGPALPALVARHGPIYFPVTPAAVADAAVEVDGPVLAEARILVCRADYPAERARSIVQALEGWSELAPLDTPLPIPRHAAVADRDPPT